MLIQLTARNVVLFERLTLDLQPGFNVLTGETGAGKSMILDAFDLVLGGRARPDIVITMNFDLTWGDEGAINHADHRATGISVLDASRDAANRWLFTGEGEPWDGIRYIYVFGAAAPTHFVDVTTTIDAGVASLREHKAYIDGLGREFDPDEFLRNMAGFAGTTAGCEYAVNFQRFTAG